MHSEFQKIDKKIRRIRDISFENISSKKQCKFTNISDCYKIESSYTSFQICLAIITG